MSQQTDRTKATVVIVAVGLLFIAGLLAQLKYLNGPNYWKWEWRSLSLGRAALFMGPPFLLLIWVLRQIDGEFASRKVPMLLGAIVFINFSMQVAAIAMGPDSLSMLKEIILNPNATNFYSAALEIGSLPDWLARFHSASLGVHSGTHPPGPIIYFYYLIRLFGPDHGAVLGGYLIGFVASLGVVVMYFFSGLWTSDVRSRLLASALYALLPALILFFPCFDQVYPICSMLLMLFWVRALNGSRWSAVFLGIVLFVATMLAYGLLTIGAFLVMYALFLLLTDGRDHTYGRRILECGLMSLAVFVALHFALWQLTGYHAIRSWRAAQHHQDVIMAAYFPGYENKNVYIREIIFGPYDFFVAAGMIALPLLGLYLNRAVRQFDKARSDVVLSFLGLATIVIINFTGLLPVENARLWLFLQPLLIVPVALELRTFAPSNRMVIFTAQWLVLIVLRCKMTFIQ